MAFGEPVVGGVQHKLVVVTHQPVGQQLGVEAVHRLGKHRQKCMSIPVVNKDRFAPVASRSNVVERTGELDSQWAGQARGLLGLKQSARSAPIFWRLG